MSQFRKNYRKGSTYTEKFEMPFIMMMAPLSPETQERYIYIHIIWRIFLSYFAGLGGKSMTWQMPEVDRLHSTIYLKLSVGQIMSLTPT